MVAMNVQTEKLVGTLIFVVVTTLYFSNRDLGGYRPFARDVNTGSASFLRRKHRDLVHVFGCSDWWMQRSPERQR